MSGAWISGRNFFSWWGLGLGFFGKKSWFFSFHNSNSMDLFGSICLVPFFGGYGDHIALYPCFFGQFHESPRKTWNCYIWYLDFFSLCRIFFFCQPEFCSTRVLFTYVWWKAFCHLSIAIFCLGTSLLEFNGVVTLR